MKKSSSPSPLMRVVRTPIGRYHLQVGLASLDLGPGDLKKLHNLLKMAVSDYSQLLADDARGLQVFNRQSPDHRLRDDEPPTDKTTPPPGDETPE